MRKLLAIMLLLPSLLFAGGLKEIKLTKTNTISFNEAFTSLSVGKNMQKLMELVASSPEEDIYIVMNSPGGSVSAGAQFINFVNSLGKNIHTITVFSASMGYHTVQGLGKRYILPSGVLMSHRARVSGLGGQFPGELNERISMLMESTGLLDKVAAKRVGLKLGDYKALIHNEFWTIGENAVKLGHADAVVSASCDSSLSGKHTKQYNTFFGLLDVEFSNCPIIVGPISINRANRWETPLTSLDVQTFLNEYVNVLGRVKTLQ